MIKILEQSNWTQKFSDFLCTFLTIHFFLGGAFAGSLMAFELHSEERGCSFSRSDFLSVFQKLQGVRMEVYGHRGGSFSAPENTLSSLQEAFALGAGGAEFDIQMTLDNEIILLHDVTLERTAVPYHSQRTPHWSAEEYARLIKTPVQELHFDEIKDIDVGMWKDPKWRGEKAPTLREALKILPPGKEYLVEVKGDDFAIIPHLQKTLRASGVPSSSLKLIGFGLEVMEEIKREMPEYKVFYLTEHSQVATPLAMQTELAKALAANMDGMDFEARSNITKDVVDQLKQNGKMVIVWVPGGEGPLDTPDNAQRMKESGVDIFTSNLPPQVMEWHKKNSTSAKSAKK